MFHKASCCYYQEKGYKQEQLHFLAVSVSESSGHKWAEGYCGVTNGNSNKHKETSDVSEQEVYRHCPPLCGRNVLQVH